MAFDLKKCAASKAPSASFDPEAGAPKDSGPPIARLKTALSKKGMQLVTGSDPPEQTGQGWRVTARVVVPFSDVRSF